MEEDAATFAKALSGASSYHWTGAGKGYLATITGANEQAFIYDYIRSTISNVSSIMYWFIGSQKTSPNATNWFWINGFPPSLSLSSFSRNVHTSHKKRTRRRHRFLCSDFSQPDLSLLLPDILRLGISSGTRSGTEWRRRHRRFSFVDLERWYETLPHPPHHSDNLLWGLSKL